MFDKLLPRQKNIFKVTCEKTTFVKTNTLVLTKMRVSTVARSENWIDNRFLQASENDSRPKAASNHRRSLYQLYVGRYE